MHLSPEDRLDILDLYARYAHLADAGEANRWAETFTPNGTFTVRAGPGVEEAHEVRGATALAAFRREHHEQFGRRGTRHQMTNIVIEATAYGASGKCYMMEVRVGDQQPPLLRLTGRHVDELVKGADGWRFRSRTFFPDA